MISTDEAKQLLADIDDEEVYEHFTINSPADAIKAAYTQIELYSDLITDAEGAIAEIEACCDEICPRCKDTVIPFTTPTLEEFNKSCIEVEITQAMLDEGLKLKLCENCFYAPKGA
jgi:hypothetical protein